MNQKDLLAIMAAIVASGYTTSTANKDDRRLATASISAAAEILRQVQKYSYDEAK